MTINRRNFIKTGIAAGTLLTMGSSMLVSCSGIKRTELLNDDLQIHPNLRLDKRLAVSLNYASLAPSGHNAQPWYVKIINQQKFVVGIDPQRRLPAVDPNNREALLSIGAFIENLCIASSSLGYQAEVDVTAKGSFDEEIVSVTLHETRPVDYPLMRLAMRRTVRNGYKPAELKSSVVHEISEPLKDYIHYFPRGSQHDKCISEGVIEAFREQSLRDDAQKELSQWMRLSNEEAKRHLDGLTVDSLEISGIAGWYVRHFMGQDDVMKDDFRKRGIDMAARYARQGGGWLVITSKGENVDDLIETGRKFERMFLMARDHMIALHPMTQMIEEDKWKKVIASRHGPGFIPQFILRAGYLDVYPDPVSLRRPVDWFVSV